MEPIRAEKPWGSMEWLVDDRIVPHVGFSLARMNLKEGMISPKHRHSNCSELIYVLEGTVEQHGDHRKSVLSRGQSFFIQPGEAHYSVNISPKAAIMLLSYSSGTRLYEPIPSKE